MLSIKVIRANNAWHVVDAEDGEVFYINANRAVAIKIAKEMATMPSCNYTTRRKRGSKC